MLYFFNWHGVGLQKWSMRFKKFKASKTSIKIVHLARKINTKLFLTFKINSQSKGISLMPIHSESKLILYPQLRKFITHLTLLLISDWTLITTKKIRFVCSHTYLKMIFWHTYPFSVLYGEFEKNKGNKFDLFWQAFNSGKIQR